MAFTFWYAMGTLSMMAKNWRLASAENPSTSVVTLAEDLGQRRAVFFATASGIIWRVRFSISGSDRSIFSRSPGSVT